MRASFDRQGYVVLPSAVAESEVRRFREAARLAYADCSWLDPHSEPEIGVDLRARAIERDVALGQRIGDWSPTLLNDAICTALRTLMDEAPVLLSAPTPFRTSPSRRAPPPASIGRDPLRNAHVHSYSDFSPRNGSILGWLALEDVRIDAGPMWIDPGSHRRNGRLFDDVLAGAPRLKERLDDLRKAGAPYDIWGRWMVDMQVLMSERLETALDEGRGTRELVLVRAGDMVLFHNALTHGTLPPTDRDATRWSVVVRYQGLHTIERGWCSQLGGSTFALALEAVPPARYSVERCGGGWRATNFVEAHIRMFWSSPLEGVASGGEKNARAEPSPAA